MKTSDEWNGITSLPWGIITGHTWHEAGQLLRLINDLDIDSFVEIGTNVGGLTSLLYGRYCIHGNFRYLGLEIDESIIDRRVLALRNPRFDVLIGDCFSEGVTAHVQNFIKGAGRCLVYCDGGNKVKELYYFAEYIRPGDVLMCHDYYDGVRQVRDVNEPRAEVRPEDLQDLTNIYPLREIAGYFELTRQIGWVRETL